MRTFTHTVDDELQLELVHWSHAEALFRLVEECRPYLRRWLGWVPQTTKVADTRRWIDDSLAAYAAGREVPMAIRWRGELCGTYGISVSTMNLAGELGYWLGERFQGHGIVSRCTAAASRLAFEDFGLKRLMIRAAEHNAPSRAIPERLDWTYEGTWRSAVLVDDRRLDMRVYSLLPDEFDPVLPSHAGRFVYAVDDEITLELVHDGLAQPMFELVDDNRNYLGEWLDFVKSTGDVDDSRRFTRDSMQSYARGTAVRCAIRFGGDLCGAIGLERINRVSRSGEIGYWVAEAYAGKAIATRAARAMTALAFDVEDLNRVESRMATGNAPSERVARKLGYRREGTARASSRRDDTGHDVPVYAMLSSDWS